MTYHEQYEHAEKVIADYEAGAYDEQFGVSPEERSALTKARNGERINLTEFRHLVALGEDELADQAHQDNHLDLDI